MPNFCPFHRQAKNLSLVRSKRGVRPPAADSAPARQNSGRLWRHICLKL